MYPETHYYVVSAIETFSWDQSGVILKFGRLTPVSPVYPIPPHCPQCATVPVVVVPPEAAEVVVAATVLVFRVVDAAAVVVPAAAVVPVEPDALAPPGPVTDVVREPDST